MRIAENIDLIPYLHGKVAFARQVRELFLSGKYDCIAVDIPAVFQEQLCDHVEDLPLISAVVARGASGPLFYVPLDPCDATIESIRQSRLKGIPIFCVGSSNLRPPRLLKPLPDEFVESKIGFDIYNSLCLSSIGLPEENSEDDLECQYIAGRLHQIGSDHSNILVLLHYRNYARVIHHFRQEKTYNMRFDSVDTWSITAGLINPDHLYFAIGELPFITWKYEKERYDLFAEPFDIVESVKDLFRETRDQYFDNKEETASLSPVRIQAALTFLRNISVMSGRMIPDLFDIVEAAKGVGGNAFAIRILKSARYYPYLPAVNSNELIGITIDRVSMPEWGVFDSVNLFRDFHMYWRLVSIKPDPSLEKKKKYRFSWNPAGMCSHVPEDRRIERFNSFVRNKSLRILIEDLVKSEKFSTSVKDGIDIRETLRNWHTGDIYVKELPPSKGKIDTVVIIFDSENDSRYPHCATWYAEHQEESTLTFYATDPMENMIGPGIAKCSYGGLSLLFPPRSIPDIFSITSQSDFPDLATRLTYGSLLFSTEKNVAYVARKKPGPALKNLAAKLKKHLVWIPLNSLSDETLQRLKQFHILNGKSVRSWAARFIGD
ncbi:MAG: hypothetical protein GX556_05925 [Fibrobacter sp.]|nr:hypothetical protein [Fibrobacter sp.]